MSHTIELRKVSKYYAGEDSVSMGFSRVDLDLDIGEFVAITGESGSGKSTLLNVISGLDTYEEGEMFVCGEDTTAYGTEDYEVYRKTFIGNIFQDFNLINSYTVYQNIEAVMLLSGKKKKDCKQRILELIELVGLTQYKRTKVSRLSGGQKQRVAIARALAKDAPVIVADEPTGNLDSESANIVMETLSRVSSDKLVVIVTHNYEQAEPYVTRKLTMHDGRIIEDKKLPAPGRAPAAQSSDLYFALKEAAEQQGIETSGNASGSEEAGSEAPKRGGRAERAAAAENKRRSAASRKMRRSAEIGLGIRNTFNLPAKFILLFIVYFFVSTAVLAQYATIKDSMHENDLLGGNPYFTNASSDRIVIKKADESMFTDQDFALVESTPNIRSIAKNDLALDSGVSFILGDFYIEGPVMPSSWLEDKELAYGHMPENDYEIVVEIDSTNDAVISIMSDGESYIGREVKIQDMYQMSTYDFPQKVTIAGIIINDSADEDSEYSIYGYSTIYTSEKMGSDLMVHMMAGSSKAELKFENATIGSENERSVYTSANVPAGKVFLFEDQTYYYKDEKAEGKDFGLKIKNRFFESEGSYKVDKIITDKNCEKLVGIPEDEFDMYYNCVFINDDDFDALFDKGYYQISAFMENEQDSDATLKALNDAGFTTLAIKDSLTDMTGGTSVVIKLLSYARLIIIFIVLFFVSYGVIKLIMRSRNTYYSTLRILGATKRNTGNILRVELLIMMLIAYGTDLIFAALVNKGYISLPSVKNVLLFLSLPDYAVLGAALLLMSLLIAGRYSKSIFTRSAMKTFRGEA